MKKLLFSVCAVLAILGCGGDGVENLPCFTPTLECESDYRGSGYCRYGSTCVYMSVNECYNYYGGTNYGNDANCGFYVYPSSSSYRSSSSSVPSSSSYRSSSSSVPSSGGYTGSYGSLSYGGQTYKTVVIGSQTWFAENLNYNPGTGNSACYENQASNCNTYGRLYDWATANAVCPSGWHLPSDAEWSVLETAVGGSSTAGTKLKATSGWYNNGNGTNQYGFSALPGGYGNSSGSFSDVGINGYWWSATESNASYAYTRYMGYSYPNVLRSYNNKSRLYSVRCVQD